MRGDKLLSPNSCTANFQLYTQMALRLEENGAPGEDSSGFLCLFGSECGGGRKASWKPTLARSWPGSPRDSASKLAPASQRCELMNHFPSWVSALFFFGLFVYTITHCIWELTLPSLTGLGLGILFPCCPGHHTALSPALPSPLIPFKPFEPVQLCSNCAFLPSLLSTGMPGLQRRHPSECTKNSFLHNRFHVLFAFVLFYF